jgi:hypothetical protein
VRDVAVATEVSRVEAVHAAEASTQEAMLRGRVLLCLWRMWRLGLPWLRGRPG